MDLLSLLSRRRATQFDIDNFDPATFDDMNVKINLEDAAEIRDRFEDDVQLVDVRSREEYEYAHVDKASLLSIDTIIRGVPSEFQKDKVLIVYCNTGGSSHAAQSMLQQKGYKVIDAGGIVGYSGKIVRN